VPLFYAQAVDIFISWSGPRSHAVAVALRTWLPSILDNSVTPFVSSEDIAKGTRGLDKIADELKNATHGIVVVTPENATQPWLNFEAGALGNSVSSAKVAPFLVGLENRDLVGPMTQFQTTLATDRQEVRKLVESINTDLGRPMQPGTIDTLFNAGWQVLEEAVAEALALSAEKIPAVEDRSPNNVIDEILTTVRGLRRDFDKLPQNQNQNRSGTPAQVAKRYGETPVWVTELFDIGEVNDAPMRQAGKNADGSYRGSVQDSVRHLTSGAQRAFSRMATDHAHTIVVEGINLGKFVFTAEGEINLDFSPAVAPVDEGN